MDEGGRRIDGDGERNRDGRRTKGGEQSKPQKD